MSGHFSPPEANFYCTMVFFLLAEVSFSFISYVGIATLCCLRYWGATPQRGPSPDCLSAAPTAQTTNRQPPRWTMDRFRSPRPWTRPGIGMPHAIPFPFSAPSRIFDRANEPPMAANDWGTVPKHGQRGARTARRTTDLDALPRSTRHVPSTRPSNPHDARRPDAFTVAVHEAAEIPRRWRTTATCASSSTSR